MLQILIMFLVCICLAQANDSSQPSMQEEIYDSGSASSDKAPDKFSNEGEKREQPSNEELRLEKTDRRSETCQKGDLEGHVNQKMDNYDRIGPPAPAANADDKVGPP